MKPLSPRMQEIAHLVAQGMSNKGIARELDLAPTTIRNYLVEMGHRIPGDGPCRWRIMAWYIREHAQREAA